MLSIQVRQRRFARRPHETDVSGYSVAFPAALAFFRRALAALESFARWAADIFPRPLLAAARSVTGPAPSSFASLAWSSSIRACNLAACWRSALDRFSIWFGIDCRASTGARDRVAEVHCRGKPQVMWRWPHRAWFFMGWTAYVHAPPV